MHLDPRPTAPAKGGQVDVHPSRDLHAGQCRAVEVRREGSRARCDGEVGADLLPRGGLLATLDRDEDRGAECADRHGHQQHHERQAADVAGARGASQAERRHHAAPALGEPAGDAQRNRVEPNGQQADGQADERRHRGQQRIHAGQLARGAAARDAPLAQQVCATDGKDDHQHLERDPSRAAPCRARCLALDCRAAAPWPAA